MNGVVIPM